MNILVIIGNYYYNQSSVANCARPLIESLAENGHKVSLVTNNTLHNRDVVETVNNVRIFGIVDKFAVSKLTINAFYDKKRLPQTIKNFLKKISKIPIYIMYGFFAKEENMGGWSIKKSSERCASLFKKEKFDLVISFSLPFTAHFIALNLLKRLSFSIPWIVYEYDPYSYNYYFRKNLLKIALLKKQENNIFSSADLIMLTPELYKFYHTVFLKKYAGKMKELPYASLQEIEISSEFVREIFTLENDTISCVYAGRLYTEIRNPECALQTFLRAKIKLKLFLITDYSNVSFRKTIEEFTERFELLDRVSHEKVLPFMEQSHILISIGNTVETQVPGKIFEYMSLGKPIIHFSKIENDPSLLYLQLYPMCLVINEYEAITEEKINDFEMFIEKYKDTSLNFEEVKRYMDGLDKDSVVKEFLSIVNSYN